MRINSRHGERSALHRWLRGLSWHFALTVIAGGWVPPCDARLERNGDHEHEHENHDEHVPHSTLPPFRIVEDIDGRIEVAACVLACLENAVGQSAEVRRADR